MICKRIFQNALFKRNFSSSRYSLHILSNENSIDKQRDDMISVGAFPAETGNSRDTLQALMPDYAQLNKIAKKSSSGGVIRPNEISIKSLMNAGVHLGHCTDNWHQNMLPYIYGKRAGVHIINLEKTFVHLRRAMNVTREIAKRGGTILFVGIRPFLQDILVNSAQTCNQFYVHQKWLRGCLSNHEHTLKKASGGILIQPDLVIVLDMKECDDVLVEASTMNVPTIGLADTNCDPMLVTYPIPGNDDAHSSVELISMLLAHAAQDGVKEYEQIAATMRSTNRHQRNQKYK